MTPSREMTKKALPVREMSLEFYSVKDVLPPDDERVYVKSLANVFRLSKALYGDVWVWHDQDFYIDVRSTDQWAFLPEDDDE